MLLSIVILMESNYKYYFIISDQFYLFIQQLRIQNLGIFYIVPLTKDANNRIYQLHSLLGFSNDSNYPLNFCFQIRKWHFLSNRNNFLQFHRFIKLRIDLIILLRNNTKELISNLLLIFLFLERQRQYLRQRLYIILIQMW